MNKKYIEKLLNDKRKFVFLGESGSGKTDIAINFVIEVSKITNKKINFIDLDQTKPLYRARDLKSKLNNENIDFSCGKQFQDAPIVPHGVCEKLLDKDSITILDVGGNKVGALTLGQFSEYLKNDKTTVFYSINPYRCFSDTELNILDTMYHIKSASKITDINILSNPNIGQETDVDIIISGDKKLKSMLEKLNYEVSATVVPNWINKDELVNFKMNLFTITPYINF